MMSVDFFIIMKPATAYLLFFSAAIMFYFLFSYYCFPPSPFPLR